MVLYDYKCNDCDHIEEIFANFDDTEVQFCPKCKGVMKRQFPLTQKHISNGTSGIIKKLERKYGTGDLQPDQLPKSNGPPMWKAPRARNVPVKEAHKRARGIRG